MWGTDGCSLFSRLLLALAAATPLVAAAAVEVTPWGTFDFPPAVRSGEEAALIRGEARLPIVVAVRYLATAETTDSPWMNYRLACDSQPLRSDYVATLVRSSTQVAARILEALWAQRDAAARYPGPVTVVLEPVRITATGETVPLSPRIEPHLRIFATASVPRCQSEPAGAFGRPGELTPAFMLTASPALELGWPSYSAGLLGQRVVMASENFLTEGFCCGQESAFGLESLMTLYDFRDYRTKARLRTALRNLAGARRRDAAWLARTRDAFGVPDRFAEDRLRELRHGNGRVAPGEVTIWPSLTLSYVSPGTADTADAAAPFRAIADFTLGFASLAHFRAELISPAILESLDPARKYSFVGWPEEFRAAGADGGVLEVFGSERRLSFVGNAADVTENIAFGVAAWRLQAAFSEERVSARFRSAWSESGEGTRALATVLAEEARTLRTRRIPPTSPESAWGRAVVTVDRIGSTLAHEAEGLPARQTLRWPGGELDLALRTPQQLHGELVDLYQRLYAPQLAGRPAIDEAANDEVTP